MNGALLFFKCRHDDQRELTCDQSSVVFSTGDVSDAAVRKVLQWFWQINLKQKSSLAQLTVLTPAERVHVLLWTSKTDTDKQTG